MKITIILASILLFNSFSSIYDIQITTIDGKQVDLDVYKGKKIIVTAFDALNPDTEQLTFLDSLQTTDKNITIIAVPALDFSASKFMPDLAKLRDSLNLHFIITNPALVKRNATQSPLFKFLTSVDENGHFNVDVEEPDQLYFIDTSGILYSILKKETPHNIVDDVRLQP